MYVETSCDRIWSNNTQQLNSIVGKLRVHTGFYDYTHDELFHEVTILFYKNFGDYYDEDDQYLRFIFIVLKNHIRNLQKKVYTYKNRYTNDFRCLKNVSIDEENYHNAWNNVVEDRDYYREYEFADIVENAKKLLDKDSRKIFLLLNYGYTVDEIAISLDYLKYDIEKSIRYNIRPIFEQLLNLS